MSVILHAVSSYPDPIAPATSASSLLLALCTDDMIHNVYSFKRAGWRGGPACVIFDDDAGTEHRAIAYGAPPKGIALARHLDRLADWIIADTEKRGLQPDIVHGHKISLDGYVGARLATHFKVPLMLSIQSNTDAKILKVRRDLIPHFRDIWRNTAMVFPFTPVAYDTIAKLLGPRDGPQTVLPCPTRADTITAPTTRPDGAGPVILTAFHLAHFGNKNIKTLLEGLAIAAKDIPDISLQIVGGGDASAFLAVTEMAKNLAPGRVTLLGARPSTEMQSLMNSATAFALISHRESYGMVYAEALLAGTPCLYSAGRAIGGLFDNGGFAVGVNPSDAAAVAAALVRFCREENNVKAQLATAQNSGGLKILRQDQIARTYQTSVAQALNSPAFAV
ncbi:MAG: glycosyltransferase [Rhodobacteraceae bacterium]|nr:glycosyltransferase [Paracoccaceae bacterium]PHR51267.1 MAG: hypothetical protein COA47_18095 [Robiginitomaculum sp.]